MLAVVRSGRLVLASLLVACAWLTAACTDPPEKEMHQAQGAIDAARAAGADEYAAEEYQAAVAALKRSTDAVQERDYRQALNYALDARERAQGAAKSAAESRAHVRSEAERLLAGTDEALARAKTAFDAAAESKSASPELAVPSQEIADVETALGEGRSQLGAGNYNKALALVTPLPDRLAKAISQIGAAVESRQAKKPVKRSGR